MIHFLKKTKYSYLFLTLISFSLYSCAEESQQMTEEASLEQAEETITNEAPMQENKEKDLRVATLGAGCFWCVEAIFEELKGVEKVESGYTGGSVENPTYKAVCDGTTGHAEVCQVTYDQNMISFDEILEVFWQTHDPTTLNRQGNDIGTQYRSAIFYHDDKQKEKAEGYKKELDASGAFNAPIVTEIVPFTKIYMAEDYHQDYYAQNPNQGYCSYVIKPKLDKFRKVFADKLK